MPCTILIIGIDPVYLPTACDLRRVTSVTEAIHRMLDTEVGMIIIDNLTATTTSSDLVELLGASSPTTRIILITSSSVTHPAYRDLGVELLTPPSHWHQVASIVSNQYQ
ncbi:MAG: hypothetical protein O2780_09445 [Proteobacteria bacterium]|jgi:hypothetical protein|nr:hypothetical protein [Pseudomonadota bacterium]